MAANSSAASVLQSLQNVPLGFMDGESNLNIPYNRGSETVLVRARNRSAELERNEYHRDRISGFRGGEVYEEERRSSKSATTFNLEKARRDAFTLGQETTAFAKVIKPINITMMFDNQRYLIPAVSDTGDISPWTAVPEGLYDLYVGNYGRMHSKDAKIKSDEIALVQLRRGKGDHDFVIRPGVTNPWAFIEFEYQIIKPTSIALDSSSVYADTIMEI